jgi:hypothetical protein
MRRGTPTLEAAAQALSTAMPEPRCVANPRSVPRAYVAGLLYVLVIL